MVERHERDTLSGGTERGWRRAGSGLLCSWIPSPGDGRVVLLDLLRAEEEVHMVHDGAVGGDLAAREPLESAVGGDLVVMEPLERAVGVPGALKECKGEGEATRVRRAESPCPRPLHSFMSRESMPSPLALFH